MSSLEIAELYDMTELRRRATALEREAKGVRAAVGHCAEAAMRRQLSRITDDVPADPPANLIDALPKVASIRSRVTSALSAWPTYSDRMLASLCGASAAAVSRERRRSGMYQPTRLGVDGRLRHVPRSGLCAMLVSICPSMGARA